MHYFTRMTSRRFSVEIAPIIGSTTQSTHSLHDVQSNYCVQNRKLLDESTQIQISCFIFFVFFLILCVSQHRSAFECTLDYRLSYQMISHDVPACSTAACTVIAPSRVAETGANEPRNKPIGVRTALAITTSCTDIVITNFRLRALHF